MVATASRILWVLILLLFSASNAAAHTRMSWQEACEIIDSRGADPLIGIWRIGPDGAIIAIIPTYAASGQFDIYLLDSPDMSVIPGERIGSASATRQLATYDAVLANLGKLLQKNQRFIITIERDGSLAFKSYKKGKRLSLWRLAPYLFRYSVSEQNTRPSSVDGAVRLYPSNGPAGPTIL